MLSSCQLHRHQFSPTGQVSAGAQKQPLLISSCSASFCSCIINIPPPITIQLSLSKYETFDLRSSPPVFAVSGLQNASGRAPNRARRRGPVHRSPSCQCREPRHWKTAAVSGICASSGGIGSQRSRQQAIRSPLEGRGPRERKRSYGVWEMGGLPRWEARSGEASPADGPGRQGSGPVRALERGCA